MDANNVLKISKLYGLSRTFIPALRDDAPRVKGFFGKIAVLGGSLEYTGAPYFSTITALRMGYDIGHVFCTMNASGPIKAYSPELIVHPILYSGSENQQVVSGVDESASAIISWLARVDVVVIGPGLSRDVGTLAVAEKIIAHARSIQMPIVLDADALVLVETNPDLVKGYSRCVVTPNHHEFSRMLETISNIYGSHVADPEVPPPAPTADLSNGVGGHAVSVGNDGTVKNKDNTDASSSPSSAVVAQTYGVGTHGNHHGAEHNGAAEDQLRRVAQAEHLANLLGNVCVVQKGEEDIITNGVTTSGCNARGAPKRSGGQGDVLSGAIAALLGWFHKAHRRQVDEGVVPDLKHATESFETYVAWYRLMHLAPHGWWREAGEPKDSDPAEGREIVAAAFGGAFLTRAYARDAFAQKQRSMAVPDMIEQIPAVTKKLFFM
eukprot:GHVS01029621.1.p1 GENE.GHVS01029621.1~~GHVS01029621.1.p1  ORF type:complete len:437 (+),score=66.19 GHVS01029621.1:549-1859(+)